MASTSPTNPDTLVTIKVNIDGSNKRFKLPLRDLGAATLPSKLRAALDIPPTSDALFERYSDSAASFVILDPANASVYKQLYRAAKAKLKLRLKVTVTHHEPIVPRPATVEDEVSSPADETPVSDRQDSRSPVPETAADAPSESPVVESAERPEGLSVTALQKEFEELLINSNNRPLFPPPSSPTVTGACPVVSSVSVACNDYRDAPETNQEPTAAISSSEVPVTVTRGAAARDRWFAELAGMSNERQNAIRNKTGCPALSTPSVYSVYCNNCENVIPDEHYHCSTCDDGDYDLCQACVTAGVVCKGESHWLIKRFVRNGKVITSTTETIAPRPAAAESKTTLVQPQEEDEEEDSTRTCNCCIQEWSEDKFVTCTTCEDYDLCIPCHVSLRHGHDPKHAFTPAAAGTKLDLVAQTLLAPGRNKSHNAICDGCDKYIYGVRHKCIDCPDWDYCSLCAVDAGFVHPGHKFIKVYEPSDAQVRYVNNARHTGIYCDGPLCNTARGVQSFITGVRYKCAVCHDTDFCASCEANPSNPHNKTHPLIKFKTPVRNVSVTTMGDHDDGRPLPVMGDRQHRPISKSTETSPAPSVNAATQVRTVAEVKPTESKEEIPVAVEAKELPATASEEGLVAHFVRDAVMDGAILAPNTVFEQTWYLRNGGTKTWPAGCTVKFTGGDNMCAVDPQHPASIHELVSAGESTTCYTEVAPGQEAGFTVLLRTPSKPGTFISYWRLTTPSGNKFGHRLWCDIRIKEPANAKPVEEAKEVVKSSAEGSQMIFPKLEKESPEASTHVESSARTEEPQEVDQDFDFDSFLDQPLDNETEDGFLTDEEYDILDASDEEYLAEQERAAKK